VGSHDSVALLLEKTRNVPVPKATSLPSASQTFASAVAVRRVSVATGLAWRATRERLSCESTHGWVSWLVEGLAKRPRKNGARRKAPAT
jgi:hypothetical protein